MSSDHSSLDMLPIMDFYSIDEVRMPEFNNRNLNNNIYPKSFAIDVSKYSDLTKQEIDYIIGLFPENAINRSFLNSITGKEPHFFYIDPDNKALNISSDTSIKIGPSFFCPGEIKYNWTKERINSTAEIFLYNTPREVSSDYLDSEKICKLNGIQALIHEFAHSIVAPLLYATNDSCIKLSNDKYVNKDTLRKDISNLFNDKAPISKYAEEYLGTPMFIEESFAEAISAYILGFSFKGDFKDSYKNSLDPFKGNLKTKDYIGQFLNGELIYIN